MATVKIRPHYDAVIVGARCAGAATAMLLARRGLRVLAIDRRPYGADALSTHAIMRGGVYLLHRWGLDGVLEAAGTPRIEWTSFDYGDERVVVDIKPRDGVSTLYGPRRTVLDRVLADAAREAGAEVRFGVALERLRMDRGRVTGVIVRAEDGTTSEIEAGIVVGADGLKSTVARLVGAETYLVGRHKSATLFAYFDGADVTGNEWAYASGRGVGAVPTNAGQTCLFVGMSPSQLREELRDGVEAGFRRLVRESSADLADRTEAARADGPYRRFDGVPGFLRQCWGPGWALVGDAGYFRDPITAHGITDAFRDSELLSRAIVEGTARALADYQEQRDDLSLRLFAITDRIASCLWTMDELKELHLQLSTEMTREASALASLARAPARELSEPQLLVG